MRRALLAATICLLFVARARAELPAVNYYVSTAGNNSNSGLSAGSAWRTIQHAVDSFDQNQHAIINVAAGTYGEAVTITKSGIAGASPPNNALTCASGSIAYTTSVTVNVAGWTVAPCVIAAAGPTATATATFTPTATATPAPTNTPTATQTPTPTATPASCPINVLGTVVSVDVKGTLRCATPTATP